MDQRVTFETKCYENDWKFLLCKGYLEQMIKNCHYTFAEKVLFINNVNDLMAVKKAADNLVNKGVIDKYYVVEKYADEALQAFGICKESFKGGYYYSIAELVSIYLCKTDYLLHFSGDAHIENSTVSWIDKAIELMDKTPGILLANPSWDASYIEAKDESFKEDAEWFYSYGFSDQCYLIRAADFKKEIYNQQNIASERYPKYGGELFEKRVDAYMRNNALVRITSKVVSYKHKNYPKNKLKKFIKLYFK
jgi:hypothetical protein